MKLVVTGAGPLYMRQIAPDGMGSMVSGPAGVSILYEGTQEYRGADVASVSSFVIELMTDVSGMLIATGLADWLAHTFRDHSIRVTINRRVVDLDDQGQVRRILEEEIIREEPTG